MGSDRARRTYDEDRQYRRVIAQQGRAVVEADINEAQEITTEEIRKEALDVVGPLGTPDGGYKLSKATGSTHTQDITVGAGTMYVGGVRVSLKDPITYWDQLEDQHEWLDMPTEEFVHEHELVYLHLTEQEVSAVEDRRLREVALGGPDTAQRSRVGQRVVRFALENPEKCGTALVHLQVDLFAKGMAFDPHVPSQMLMPLCALKAKFNPLAVAGLCSPTSYAAYLGAENQLIRVQISAADKLVWAFDNASSLYRVSEATSGTSTTVTLATRPVDAQHEPAKDQFVEVLRARVDLGDGDYVAAPTGVVLQITSYDKDKGIVTLQGTLPAEYLSDLGAEKPLFARIWQQEITFTVGTPVPIGVTGLQVTLSGTAFAVGSFWTMALRPAAPDQIFPKRYTEAPQPPEGPRQWLCLLGVLNWTPNAKFPAYDCRRLFSNLAVLSQAAKAKYTDIASPAKVSDGLDIQAAIDAIADAKAVDEKAVLGLLPGIYEMRTPLVFEARHSNITIEGSRDTVIAKAVDTTESFVHGLAVMKGAQNVEFKNLTFQMEKVQFEDSGGKLAGFTPTGLYNSSNQAIDYRNMEAAVGVRVFGGSVAMRDCVFDYSRVTAPTEERIVFAAGVLAGGDVEMLDIQRSAFTYEEPLTSRKQQVFGIVHSPSTAVVDGSGCRTVSGVDAGLSDGLIRENHFKGLRAATLIHAAPRRLQIESNVAEDCYSGFWVVPHKAMASTEESLTQSLANLDSTADSSSGGSVASSMATGVNSLLEDPLLADGGAIARCYPLPSDSIEVTTLTMSEPAPQIKLNKMVSTIEEAVLPAHPTAAASDVPDLIGVVGNRVVSSGGQETNPGAGRGTALMVWDASHDMESGRGTSVVASSNWMGGSSTFAPVTLFGVKRCASSGNTVQNLTDTPSDAYSMIVVPPTIGSAPDVAVMGNTFSAKTVLPKREQLASEPTVPWAFFNQHGSAATTGQSTGRGLREIHFDSDVATPVISQWQRTNTGENAGVPLLIQGQQGQPAADGATQKNNGGAVHIEGGEAGGGTTGAAGKQGEVRLASNGYTLDLSPTGVDVDLGAATVPLAFGNDTVNTTGPARWLSSGTDFLSLVGLAPPQGGALAAVVTMPGGLVLSIPGQPCGVMMNERGFDIQTAERLVVNTGDHTCGFSMSAEDGFRLQGNGLTVESNGYTLGLSQTGLDIELGAATVPLVMGEQTMYTTGPARWLTTGTEFLRLVGLPAPEGGGTPIAFLSASNGLFMSPADQSTTFMIGSGGVNVGVSTKFEVGTMDESCTFHVSSTDGFFFHGKAIAVDGGAVSQSANTVQTVDGVAQIDLTKSNYHTLQLTGDTTITFTGPTGWMRVELRVAQVNPGNHTVTWGSGFSFYQASDGEVNAVGQTIYEFTCDGSTMRCMNVKKGF